MNYVPVQVVDTYDSLPDDGDALMVYLVRDTNTYYIWEGQGVESFYKQVDDLASLPAWFTRNLADRPPVIH